MKFINTTKEYKDALATYHSSKLWSDLEKVHILAQSFLLSHYFVHITMLQKALKEKNLHECLGQIFRLMLVLPGNLLNRLPKNNPGTARVSAFKSF